MWCKDNYASELFMSKSDHLEYCGQYWPSRHRVQIAILDAGIGIRASLSANKRLNVEDDLRALKLAVLPGISGNPTVSKRDDDPWANTGYGLFMVNRFCLLGGCFTFSSGNGTLEMSSLKNSELGHGFKGTLVGLEFDTNNLPTFREATSSFLREAMEI